MSSKPRPVVAHENVLLRMSNGFGDSPETEVDLELWPTETYIGEYYKLPYFTVKASR